MAFKALIFDVDGVVAETEADGHRVAFNKVFEEEGIDARWDQALYGELLKIAGGKERMKTVVYSGDFKKDVGDKEEYIKKLHKRKTEIFQRLILEGGLPARPGVKRIIEEAHERGIKLGVGSTSNIDAVTTLLKSTLGEKVFGCFNVVLAGDVVKRKKPDPEIYSLNAERLGVAPAECCVVEDMVIGLEAARAIGMKCVVTRSFYSRNDDFSGADLVVDSLGEPGDKTVVTVDTVSGLFRQGGKQ